MTPTSEKTENTHASALRSAAFAFSSQRQRIPCRIGPCGDLPLVRAGFDAANDRSGCMAARHRTSALAGADAMALRLRRGIGSPRHQPVVDRSVSDSQSVCTDRHRRHHFHGREGSASGARRAADPENRTRQSECRTNSASKGQRDNPRRCGTIVFSHCASPCDCTTISPSSTTSQSGTAAPFTSFARNGRRSSGQ